MAIQTVRNVLVAAGPVTAIVGSRIYPMVKAQDVTIPAVTLQRITNVPVNALRQWTGLDQNTVQVDSWDTDYTRCRSLALAIRTALQAAGYQMQSERDDYDAASFMYRVSQDWQIWI